MKRRILMGLIAVAAIALGAWVIFPYVLPWALARHRSDIQFAVATEKKTLFLTVDDAPSQNTSEILRVLKKHGVTATFFIIADRVKSPTQLDAIVAGGHSLGNHLKTTKACSQLSLAEFSADFDRCAALLEQHGKARLFRPASDFGTKEQIAYARSQGCRATLGTVFPLDHWISDSAWLARLSAWLAIRGGIVILHDGDARGQTTAEVLDRLIPKLKAAGYTFGRLDEEMSPR
jgi:peptidoglycan-N-acetylglucosamine deacetylase